MPRHLIGDAHEWINEIPTVPTHSLAKLQPSQRSWDMYLCVTTIHMYSIYFTHSTAGQEDPFELDSNLLLSAGQQGKDRKRQTIPSCIRTTMKHRYLTIWLTYRISIAP